MDALDLCHFKLLPPEANYVCLSLRKDWYRQYARFETILDCLSVEYNQHHQRVSLDSYDSFKETLKDLSCLVGTMRKFGIHLKLTSAQSSVFMRIYADVIHTVVGWNEYKTTLRDCLNIATFDHDNLSRWNDTHIKLWAFKRGTSPDSEITPEDLFDDY